MDFMWFLEESLFHQLTGEKKSTKTSELLKTKGEKDLETRDTWHFTHIEKQFK